MRYLTFALGKGRLAKKTMELFRQIGITCEEMQDPATRKLIFVNEELKLKFFLAKAPDVPTYVEYGAADVGIVGKDTILEEGRRMRENAISVDDLRDNRNAVLIMDELIMAQRIEVAKAAEVVELAREKLTEIMQERKMHEKLKEKALLQFLDEEKAAEFKVVDELTSYTYGQRGKENGNGS